MLYVPAGLQEKNARQMNNLQPLTVYFSTGIAGVLFPSVHLLVYATTLLDYATTLLDYRRLMSFERTSPQAGQMYAGIR